MTLKPARMLFLSFAALLLLLAACGEDDFGADPPTTTPAPDATATPAADPTATPTTPAQDTPLANTEWILSEIAGSPALDETQVTLEFTDDGVGGYSGCNWYGGGADISGDTIRFDDLAMTLRLCAPDSINEQEQRFHGLLREVQHFDVSETTLTLLDADRAATLVFERREVANVNPAALAGTTWRLVSHDGVAADGPPGLLTFEDDGASFTTRDGCYNHSGRYVADGDQLRFPESNANAYACLQPLETQSSHASLTSAMGDVAWYSMSEDESELTLHHYDGGEATFSRQTEALPDDAWAITWELEAIVVDGAPEPLIDGTVTTLQISNPSLQIDEPQPVRGSSGCNTYQASITASADTLTISEIIVTEMGCPEPAGVMEQEQRVLELLGEVTSHNIYEENTLQLITEDGTTLVFQPQD